MKKQKRQVLEVKGGYNTNTFHLLSFSSSEHIKCPVNISESFIGKAWKDFRLYVKFLDLKVQNPDVGTFQICHSHRYYQRTIKQLIARGWAKRKGREVYLKAYQFVWKDLGIPRVNDNGIQRFKYWKIPVSIFSDHKKKTEIKEIVDEHGEVKIQKIVTGYLVEIEHEIRKKISKRKLAQIRYALKGKGEGLTRADQTTFSAKSAGTTFGYQSPYTGSKLRQKYFEVIPMTKEEAKPKFNKQEGRFKEPTKSIAI